MIWMAIGIVVWVISGIIAYGCQFAYWQREWPEIAEQDVTIDRITSLAYAVISPMGLILVVSSRWHGIMFTPDWKRPSLDSFLLPSNGDEG